MFERRLTAQTSNSTLPNKRPRDSPLGSYKVWLANYFPSRYLIMKGNSLSRSRRHLLITANACLRRALGKSDQKSCAKFTQYKGEFPPRRRKKDPISFETIKAERQNNCQHAPLATKWEFIQKEKSEFFLCRR